jgi:hypothetical protein
VNVVLNDSPEKVKESNKEFMVIPPFSSGAHMFPDQSALAFDEFDALAIANFENEGGLIPNRLLKNSNFV